MASVSTDTYAQDVFFAHHELIRELASVLRGPVFVTFKEMYASAVRMCKEAGTPDKAGKTFQNMLATVPGWTEERQLAEAERIVKASGCAYADDLLQAAFSSYIRSMSSLREYGPAVRLEVDVPTFEAFVHRLYVHVARKYWQEAALFKRVDSSQEAANACLAMIDPCVLDAIRASLSIERILQQLNAAEDDAEPAPAPAPAQPAPAPAPAPVAPVPAPAPAPAPAPVQAPAKEEKTLVLDLQEKKVRFDLPPDTASEISEDDDDDRESINLGDFEAEAPPPPPESPGLHEIDLLGDDDADAAAAARSSSKAVKIRLE